MGDEGHEFALGRALVTHLRSVGQGMYGPRASVETLYRDYAKPLRLWLACRVPRNDLDDASQAVWSRVTEHYTDKFDGNNFRAWLFRIAKNYLIDESRRDRPMPGTDEDESFRAAGGGYEPCEILINREYRSRFTACIEKLEEPRKAIVRARLAGMDYDEFVATMNLSKQQAFQYFFAAKKQLQACMGS